MSAEDTIAFLVRYNRWRRGDESIEQPNPQEVGQHLEAAIDLLRGEGTCLECGGPLQAVRPGKHQCNNCQNMRHIETMLGEMVKLAAVLKRERDEARQQLATQGESKSQGNPTRHCGRVEKTEQDLQQ